MGTKRAKGSLGCPICVCVEPWRNGSKWGVEPWRNDQKLREEPWRNGSKLMIFVSFGHFWKSWTKIWILVKLVDFKGFTRVNEVWIWGFTGVNKHFSSVFTKVPGSMIDLKSLYIIRLFLEKADQKRLNKIWFF